MLIIPEHVAKEEHVEARKGLVTQFNKQLEDILNQNKSLEKYWVLGKVRFPPEHGGRVGHVFLEACKEKPPLINEAFLYEIDNTKGVKTLMWVMNKDGSLRLPTLNKTIRLQRA